MELRQLRCFVTLAEELHFGRVAARLYVTQSALSQEIRKLERELGLTLFTRTPRRVALTAAGGTLLAEACRALEAGDRVLGIAQRLARGEAGQITVGFVASTAPDFMPGLVSSFCASNPNVLVHLHEAQLSDPSAGLRAGLCDVALIWPPVDVPGLELHTLLTERRVAVLPAGHPLAGQAKVGLEELEGEVFCAVDTDDRLWRDFWLAADQRRRFPPTVGPTVRTMDGMFAAVAAGAAIGLAPAGAARWYANPAVRFVPVTGLAPAILALAWPEGYRTALAERFGRAAIDLADVSGPRVPGTVAG